MSLIQSIEQLESIYGFPGETATAKVTEHITDDYRAFIEASPLAILASVGPEGVDCSPRGDLPGFVRVVDSKTVHMPDRRGNNRMDSLRNIVRDSRVSLLFLIPGCGNTLRLIGHASLSIDPELCKSFAVKDQAPRSVIIISVEQVYFQCARAIVRSDLWNPKKHVDPATLPSPGTILANISDHRIGGEEYDREWPQRAKKTLW